MKRLLTPVLLAAATAALTTGCAEDLKKGRTEAKVAEVPAKPAPKAAPKAAASAPAEKAPVIPADAKTLNFDNAASKFVVTGAKISEKHSLTFKKWTGTAKAKDGALFALDVNVDVTSLDAHHPKLTGHLLSPDFLDVKKFPTSTFKSTKITKGAKGEGMTHTIEGDLTMHGKTKRITFPAKVTFGKDGALAATTEFVINRQDFEITYPGRPDDLIQDSIVFALDLTAK